MKRSLLLAFCAVAAGFLAFGLTRHFCADMPVEITDEVSWMRDEFNLTPVQTAAIETLHDDYHPVCMEHCRLIARARKDLASAADKTAAHAELLRLEAVCQAATRAHLQRVAAAMPPDQGARFLTLVLPKLSHHEHNAPLGLK